VAVDLLSESDVFWALIVTQNDLLTFVAGIVGILVFALGLLVELDHIS
jgi:hypothetical protein